MGLYQKPTRQIKYFGRQWRPHLSRPGYNATIHSANTRYMGPIALGTATNDLLLSFKLSENLQVIINKINMNSTLNE